MKQLEAPSATAAPPHDLVARPDDLRAWRHERLGRLKLTDEYRGLNPDLQRLVNRLILAKLHPERGIFAKQETLANELGVSRETMNRYLGTIRKAGVLVSSREPQHNLGRHGGARYFTVYRINPEILPAEERVQQARHVQDHTGTSPSGMYLNTPFGRVAAAVGIETPSLESSEPSNDSPASYEVEPPVPELRRCPGWGGHECVRPIAPDEERCSRCEEASRIEW